MSPSIDLTDYTRWITASIFKHIDSNRQDVLLYVEGQERSTSDSQRWLEARVDGPLQRPCGSKNEWDFDVSVNILCSVQFQADYFYEMQDLLGIASQALNMDIYVYRLGKKTTDDESFVGCLQLKGDLGGLQAHHFGQADNQTKLIQGSVEGHYVMVL